MPTHPWHYSCGWCHQNPPCAVTAPPKAPTYRPEVTAEKLREKRLRESSYKRALDLTLDLIERAHAADRHRRLHVGLADLGLYLEQLNRLSDDIRSRGFVVAVEIHCLTITW